jgi:DNA-binding transcriptional ArsR family regulator
MLDNLYPPHPSRVVVDIAPVYNALGSMVTIADAHKSPGIGDWPLQIRAALSQEEWQKHYLITSWIGIEALSHAADTPAALASFPDFIRALAGREPVALRDGLLHSMVNPSSARLDYKHAPPPIDDPLSLLESEQAFFSFYHAKGKEKEVRKTLRRLYDYLLDPPALQSLIAGYIDHFWQRYFEAEWAHILPDLEEAVTAFQAIDTAGMSHFEVIEAVTHRNLRGSYRAEVLSEYTTLRLIPSFHCGPYILRFGDGQELRLVFSAHHLLDLARDREAVDHTYVVDRLKALGDETRLQIIHLLRTRGELGTQAIIDALALSKSATSRHLRQLYANNIVDVRVDKDGTSKYYRLDPGFRQEMQNLLDRLLGRG